jgi:vacuolar-type H+-ATPase subunit F/Vma7
MGAPVFLGDEVSAAGYRLAGLRTRVPEAGDLLSEVRRACAEAPLVLLGAELAARLPAAELDRLLAGIEPAVLVVPDVRGQVPIADLATRLRRQLGVLE